MSTFGGVMDEFPDIRGNLSREQSHCRLGG